MRCCVFRTAIKKHIGGETTPECSRYMRMYWAARPTMHLRQLVNWRSTQTPLRSCVAANCRRQIRFNRPGVSVTVNVTVPATALVTAVEIQREEAYAVVAQIEEHLTNREKNIASGCQGYASEVPSSSSLNTGSFHVYLTNNHTMDRCPLAVNKNELIAIHEVNWKNVFSSRFKRPFRLAWQGRRQKDARRVDQGYENQGPAVLGRSHRRKVLKITRQIPSRRY